MDSLVSLSIGIDLPPMEARAVNSLPDGDQWQFEPKWDGFRCLIFRSGDAVALQSKSGKPLGRYFPEVVEAVGRLECPSLVLDGELVIPVGDILSFEALQMRLHPASSRVNRLAGETPARLMLFDCLLDPDGKSLIDAPLDTRRERLEDLLGREDPDGAFRLSARTFSPEVALGWLRSAGPALDGVIAKDRTAPYCPGERTMLKLKNLRTADCVVGGFRYASREKVVGSLLLGLYDEENRLNHVGFTSAIAAADRPALTRRLEALIEPPGFTGNAPGGPSRWSTDRSADWQPLRPDLVVEVRYDHVTADRFRHGTQLMRWRPDKAPRQCRMDQLQQEARPALLGSIMTSPHAAGRER